MGIYLGNMSIEDIEAEHGFNFSDEERDFLRENWHKNATFRPDESGWHMFYIPNYLEISNDEIGLKCLDIFQAHSNDYKHSFPGGYA